MCQISWTKRASLAFGLSPRNHFLSNRMVLFLQSVRALVATRDFKQYRFLSASLTPTILATLSNWAHSKYSVVVFLLNRESKPNLDSRGQPKGSYLRRIRTMCRATTMATSVTDFRILNRNTQVELATKKTVNYRPLDGSRCDVAQR